MTDLLVSIAILALWIVACVAVKVRLDHLDRRRCKRNQIRRIMRYHVAHHNNVVAIDTYSRKVDAA